jgi:hypothetical protein
MLLSWPDAIGRHESIPRGQTRRWRHLWEAATMPVVSTFYGITVQMYYNDHPPPHFHAIYGEHELVVQILPVNLLQGTHRIECSRWFMSGRRCDRKT